MTPPRRHYVAEKCLAKGMPVVLSLTGDTEMPWPHCYADPGRMYDLECLRGLHVVIATRPRINASHAIVGAFKLWDEAMSHSAPYPTLVDTERREVFFICDTRPTRWMRPHQGSSFWNAYFPAAAA